ncbi:MAG: efflux RND transporter periplasmic adaptor subunit [Planctomycetota bacterium]
MSASPGRFLLLLGLVLVGCSKELSGTGAGMDAVESGGYTFPVTFVEIAGGFVEEITEFSGDVASKRKANLAFERAGRIVEVLAAEGDYVKAGQVLARLDDRVLEADLQAARALQEAAKVQRAFAQQELKRYQGMAEAAADSVRDKWRFEIALRTAREAQRSAETQRLERQLEQGSLRAPFTGVLVKRRLTFGGYALPGGTVFELIDLIHREVRVELPQSLALGLHPGLTVEIQSASLPQGSLTASLDAVLPSTQSAARTFTGLIGLGLDADPKQRLLPGAFVLVRMQTRSAQSNTIVPADAMVRWGDAWAVVVADEGMPPSARFVPVLILANDGTQVAVSSAEEGALKAGDLVVVTGTDNIFPHASLLLQPHRNPSPDGLRDSSTSGS